MPRSKRDKKISLTKTTKKGGLEFKQRLVEEIRNSVEEFSSIYHFSFENMNNDMVSSFRKCVWADSRFFFAKNRVMQLGLGRTRDTEAATNLHRLAKHLNGSCGLLFTNKPRKEVISWFSQYTLPCIAQAGAKATTTLVLPAGALMDVGSSTEPYLRSLGLPTELKKGQINLLEEYVVCKKGQPIKPESAKILKVLHMKVGVFQMHLKHYWKKDGTYKTIKAKKTAPAESELAESGDVVDACTEDMDVTQEESIIEC